MGLTQAELGNKLGVIKQTISSWETGVSSPNSETLATMAKLFGVSVDYLLETQNPTDQLPSDVRISCNSIQGTHNLFLDYLLKDTFISRLKKLLTEKDISIDEFSKTVSFGAEKCNAYISGKLEPSLEDLIEISQIFNVSTDYLLGQIPKITVSEKKLLNTFINLNEDNQDILIGKAKELLKEQQFNKSVITNKPLKRTGTDSLGK